MFSFSRDFPHFPGIFLIVLILKTSGMMGKWYSSGVEFELFVWRFFARSRIGIREKKRFTNALFAALQMVYWGGRLRATFDFCADWMFCGTAALRHTATAY